MDQKAWTDTAAFKFFKRDTNEGHDYIDDETYDMTDEPTQYITEL